MLNSKIIIINLINKILFVFLTIIPFKASFSASYGHGTPYVSNISSKDYGYENQNFSITQDDFGKMYFGNISGILEYDGNSWNLIKINGAPELIKATDGKIYAGGFNDFGYVKTTKKGINIFQSLINKLDPKYQNFGTIYSLSAFNNKIFFNTDYNIFIWDIKTEKFEILNINASHIFSVNNSIFAYSRKFGLQEYVDDKFQKSGIRLDENNKIFDMLLFGEKILLYTAKGFFTMENNEITKFNTDAELYLTAENYTKSCVLSNGFLAIGTIRGLIIVDKEGKTIQLLNKQSGLLNEEINDLFIDDSGRLWLAVNKGLSYIDIPSSFSIFNETSEIEGLISSIIEYKNILYVATTQSVFYKEKGNVKCNKFKKIPHYDYRTNSFNVINNKLYTTTTEGIFSMDKNGAKKVFKEPSFCIFQSKKDSNIIYVGHLNGLSALRQKNGVWKNIGAIKNLSTKITTIGEDKAGDLWLGTNFSGIFKVVLPEGFHTNAKVINYNKGNGLPHDYEWIDIYLLNNKIVFSTFKGLFRYDSEKDYFYRDTLLSTNNNTWFFPIVEDKNKNVWYSSGVEQKYDKTTAVAYFKGSNKKYEISSSPFLLMKDFTVETIYLGDNNIVWLGGFDGIVRFDVNSFNQNKTKYNALIQRITFAKDSVVSYGNNISRKGASLSYNNEETPYFNKKYNSVRFDFAATSYIHKSKIEYQYFLDGFDKSWSDWSSSDFKEYTNLYEGEYTFHLRAKNIFNEISTESIYSFEIITPFLKSWIAYIGYLIVIFSFLIMVIRRKTYIFAKERYNLEEEINQRTEELVIQKERSEELVANILPKETAEELKSDGKAKSKKYELSTVLFSDIQGFTEIMDNVSPESVIEDLDVIFEHFDRIVESYNIEKIKTIGDAYMCAGGIPTKNITNPIETVQAAIEMQKLLKTLKFDNNKINDFRIGIHTGPLVAGVVGSKKFSYDIWGDTVNIASRMESSGEVGKINISAATYDKVKNFFVCQYRGKIPIKYKGDVEMYYVTGYQPELSIGGESIQPNALFNTRLQLIRFNDLYEKIVEKLKQGLSPTLYYHNLKHTVDVVSQVEKIGQSENVSEEEMLMLKTAALFHDNGFLIGYDDHELLGVKMAKEELPKYGYTKDQIQIISDLIYSTKFPPAPNNLLEEIICDADLDYLGRTDFIPYSRNLFRELSERKKIKSMSDWNKIQVSFIEKHQYYTETARSQRDINKQKQLENLKKMV